MKKLAHFCGIMLAATSFMFQSCDDSDGYSIGDIAVDWATVEAKDSHTYSLTGDTWGTLWPAASAFPWSPEDGERVVIVFNPLYDDFQGYDCAIKIEGIRSILTKDVEELTEENDAELGNDPIYIEKEEYVDRWRIYEYCFYAESACTGKAPHQFGTYNSLSFGF